MDAHLTSLLAGNSKAKPVMKSKYKKQINEATKYSKIKAAAAAAPPPPPPPPPQRRTFGTIRDPNIPTEITLIPEKPKKNHTTLRQRKADDESEIQKPAAVPKPADQSAKKTASSGKSKLPKKKEADGVKTPVTPEFWLPDSPYLSPESCCSSSEFDRLETASYRLRQIKSAEKVGKHFVSVAFFRLAHHCKAEPAQNLENGLKKYLARHDNLSSKAEWEDVCRLYGILKKACEMINNMTKKD